MNPHHALRMREPRRDGLDGKRGGVGRENRIGAHAGFEVAKDRLLGFQLFDGRLNHEVDGGHRRGEVHRRDAIHAGGALGRGENPALHRLPVERLDRAKTLRQRFGGDILEHNRESACAHPLCDACTHHSSADHRDTPHGRCRGRRGHGEFFCALLQKENPEEMAALRRCHQFKKCSLLQREPGFKRPAKRGRADLDCLEWRRIMAAGLGPHTPAGLGGHERLERCAA